MLKAYPAIAAPKKKPIDPISISFRRPLGILRALSRWQFLLVKQPICRRQAVTKSTGCAKAHRAKMASKSAILGQRDNAGLIDPQRKRRAG